MRFCQYDFRLVIFAVDSVSATCIPGLLARGIRRREDIAKAIPLDLNLQKTPWITWNSFSMPIQFPFSGSKPIVAVNLWPKMFKIG